MSIRRTLWTLPVVSTAIFAVGLSTSAYFTTRAISGIESNANITYPVLDKTGALINDVKAVTAGLQGAITAGEQERIAATDKLADKVRQHIAELRAVPTKAELGARIAKEFDDYYNSAKAGTEWMMGISKNDEKASMQHSVTALKDLEQDLQATNQAARKEFAAGTEESKSNVHQVLNSTLISALIVTLVLIGISWLVVQAVWRRLGGEPEYAHEIATAIAQGDLSMQIAVEEGDTDSLLAAMQQMKQTLGKMIADIKTSGATINTASAEIAMGNADLSARTESQASSLEEVASAMEQMTSTVKANMDNALNANRMSADAAQVAERGGAAVSRTIQTMAEINDSAQRIADIIGVIDGIAFQTNILALNAAVEAARAGEQGRGFAVVATEVRSLAQRSASAAKEIKELINESVSRVEAGSTVVNQAGSTMSEVVAAISNVAEIMNGITVASQEQTSGIEEIGRAIAQMDQTTQQNAAMVEQASAAAASLKEQAASLARSLSVFRLSAGDGNPALGHSAGEDRTQQLAYRSGERQQRMLGPAG